MSFKEVETISPVNFRLDIYHHFPDAVPHDARLDQVLTLVNQIKGDTTKIMANEQQVIDALQKIDAATTKTGGNIQIIADTLQVVSKEVDDLETALKNAGVSDTLVSQATSLGDRVQAASDALDAQVPVLQAIAAKGVVNPVPVEPPPPPPPPPPVS